jgi:hypothetical protein
MIVRTLLVLACAGAVSAADLPPLPKDVADAVASARALPPELFSDAMVRLIEHGAIVDVGWQKRLLNDAFLAAQQSREPYRWLRLPGLSEDTRESYRARAGDLHLDALSLENRVLALMVTVDRAGSRELFSRISRPQLDSGTCEDALIADPSAYYESASRIAQSTFSAEERRQSAHAQFLAGVLGSVSTTTELAAFVQSLEMVELQPAELQILGGAIEAKLSALAHGYRSFGLRIDQLAAALDFFAARETAQGLPTDPLGAAFRRYLVNQMQGPRCKEDSAQAAQFLSAMPVLYLGPIAPLTAAEMKPSKRGGEFRSKPYFDTDRTKDLADSLNALTFDANGAPYSAENRQSSHWTALFDQFLREYESWTPSGSGTDILHQRMTVLRKLLEITPPGDERMRALDLCLTTLRSADPREHPAEWEWESRSLQSAAGP